MNTPENIEFILSISIKLALTVALIFAFASLLTKNDRHHDYK